MVFASHCNRDPMAPRIFGDLTPLFLQVIPLLPCWTSTCSHWSFTSDVKENKPRPLLVFVVGNLVIASWILLTPSRGWHKPGRSRGQEGGVQLVQSQPGLQGQARKQPVKCLGLVYIQ